VPGFDAVPADTVAGEPREEAVVLMDLGQVLPPFPHPASIAYRGAASDPLSGYVVRAVVMMLRALALAPIALGTNADANLVDPAGLSATRDDPPTASLVALKNVLSVKLEEAEPSKNIGGWCLLYPPRSWLRYSSLCHKGRTLLCGRASGRLGPPPGPFMFSTATHYLETLP